MTNKRKTILSIIFLIALGISLLGASFVSAFKSTPDIESKIGQFLDANSREDYDSAYDMTTKQFQKEISEAQFKKQSSDLKPSYEGYQSLKLESFNFQHFVGKPTMYTYVGELNYEDGSKGRVNAILIKENKEWKIQNINLTVDPAKFKDQQSMNK